MKLVSLLFLFIFVLSSQLYAKSEVNESLLNEYLKLQKEYVAETCSPGTEETYTGLEKNYKGDGNFIPVLLDEKIDLKTIKNLIPLMNEKVAWMQTQIDFIKKIKDQESLHAEIDRIGDAATLLVDAKKEYYFANDKAKKEIQLKAQKQFELLLVAVEQLKTKIPFLLSFKFPVNHLALRTEYEKFKVLNTKESRGRSNSIYLFRRIVQDGSYDEDLAKNDAVIRSAFDTLYLSLTKEPNRIFLSENERVDLIFVLRNFDKLLSLKPESLVARFEEWKARSLRTLAFYQDLAEAKKIKLSEESQIKDVTSLLEERARSLYILKDFVLTREARAYEFWSRKSEMLQAIYALETILYSEVGRMDAPDALERRDVAQVVINRSENANYNMLTEKDSLTKFLSSKDKIKDNKWLNVLFKEGEFSFTYFYIPGNFHIYCPDMSRVGQSLRKENVKIAIELLAKPRSDFKALRYFSRTSMYGRIEMDSLWDDFAPIGEVPGKLVRAPKKIYELFMKDRYKLFYDFANNALGKKYLVVELKGKTYVVDSLNPKRIYYYRNPHQFKYFTLLK